MTCSLKISTMGENFSWGRSHRCLKEPPLKGKDVPTSQHLVQYDTIEEGRGFES